MKKIIVLNFLIVSIIMSCSSDGDSENSAQNVKYLKSKVYTNLPPNAPNYDEFFNFNNNVLISASGYTNFAGNYSYNQNGCLMSRNSSFNSYTYEFDSQNRVIKEINSVTGNYYSLEYDSNIINVYEYYNGETTAFSRLTIDGNGKIIQYRNLKETTSYTSMLENYSYDSNGNIIERRYEENNYGDPDVVVNFEYDNKQNPYFESLKNLYQSIYYLECRSGVPNYADRGLTPNNILKIMVDGLTTTTYNYEYDEDGYPTFCSRTSQSGTTEFTFEYH